MNKDIIINIFKDESLSKLIFDHVHSIHKIHINNNKRCFEDSITGSLFRDTDRAYKWKDIKGRPECMAKFNMFKYINQYYSKIKDINKIMSTAYSVINQSLINGNLQILKYMFDEVIGNKYMKVCLVKSKSDLILDVLSKKTKRKSTTLEIIQYLHLIYGMYHKIEEDRYFQYYKQSPETGNLSIVKWFDNKTESFKKKKSTIEILEEMFSRAVSSGSADIFSWLLEKMNSSFKFKNLWRKAINSGSIDLLECMMSNEQLSVLFDRSILISYGITSGQRHVIEWLYKQNCTIPSPLKYEDIDKQDNPEFIDWIFNFFKSAKVKDVIPFNKSIDWYCHYSKERVKSSKESSKRENMNSTFDYALSRKNMNIFKWLHANQVDEQCSPYSLTKAHYSNDIEFVQWLYGNRTERCTDMFDKFIDTSDPMQVFISSHYPKLIPSNLLECNNGYAQLSHKAFKNIVRNCPQHIGLKSLITACHYGDIKLVKIIHDKLFKDYPSYDSSNSDRRDYQLRVGSDAEIKAVLHQAVKDSFNSAPMEVTEFLFKNAVVPIESNLNKDYLMDTAIHMGNMELIKYLHNNTVCKLNPASSKMLLKRKLSEDDISSMKALRKRKT